MRDSGGGFGGGFGRSVGGASAFGGRGGSSFGGRGMQDRPDRIIGSSITVARGPYKYGRDHLHNFAAPVLQF